MLEVLERAEVPSGRIYSIADIAADLHYQARGMIERHKLGEHELLLPGIVPKLSRNARAPRAGSGPRWASTPTRSSAAAGYAAAEIAALRGRGVIA